MLGCSSSSSSSNLIGISERCSVESWFVVFVRLIFQMGEQKLTLGAERLKSLKRRNNVCEHKDSTVLVHICNDIRLYCIHIYILDYISRILKGNPM